MKLGSKPSPALESAGKFAKPIQKGATSAREPGEPRKQGDRLNTDKTEETEGENPITGVLVKITKRCSGSRGGGLRVDTTTTGHGHTLRVTDKKRLDRKRERVVPHEIFPKE